MTNKRKGYGRYTPPAGARHDHRAGGAHAAAGAHPVPAEGLEPVASLNGRNDGEEPDAFVFYPRLGVLHLPGADLRVSPDVIKRGGWSSIQVPDAEAILLIHVLGGKPALELLAVSTNGEPDETMRENVARFAGRGRSGRNVSVVSSDQLDPVAFTAFVAALQGRIGRNRDSYASPPSLPVVWRPTPELVTALLKLDSLVGAVPPGLGPAPDDMREKVPVLAEAARRGTLYLDQDGMHARVPNAPH